MVLVLHAVAGAQQAAPKSDACPRCLAEVLEAQPSASRAHLPTLFSSLPSTSTINSTCETKDLLIATLLAELAAARAEIRELRLRARSPPVSRRGVARDTDFPRGPGPSASQLRESANPVSASSRRRVSAGPYYADMCRLTQGLVLAAFCRLLARKLGRLEADARLCTLLRFCRCGPVVSMCRGRCQWRCQSTVQGLQGPLR
jgi:hypothetical protein